MASLEELKKRLYRERETFEERMTRPELSRPKTKKTFAWSENGIAKPSSNNRWFWMALGIVLIALGVGGALFFFLVEAPILFKPSEAKVEIVGIGEIKSGDNVSWEVRISNVGKRDLKDAVLIFYFPEGAAPIFGDRPDGPLRERKSLGLVRAGESAVETFQAFVFGGQGSQKKASATLEYRPDGASAIFATDAEFAFSVVSVPIAVSLKMPDELRIGQEVEFEVHYNSVAESVISNLVLALNYPEGFEYSGSLPRPDPPGNNTWKIGDVAPAASGLIKIKGIIKGSNLESKTFKAAVGVLDSAKKTILPYDETSHVAVLRSPFLETSFLVNGRSEYAAFPGENLSFEVIWRNNIPAEVKNAVLEVKLGGAAFDLSSLDVEEGFYRESTKSIVWNASSYPKFRILGPGDSGRAMFRLRVKSNIALDSASPRPKISLTSVLKSSSDVAGFEGIDVSGSNVFDVKVSSKLQFAARALYFNAPLANSGPLPPRVGAETLYTITWSLTNMANDLDGVVVKSSLPAYMTFKNVVSPADTDMVFNRASGEIEWRVGRLIAGTGFLRPALQIAFQVGLIPSPAQVGESPVIAGPAEASGRDTFTDQILTSRDAQITTELLDDPGVSFNQRNVAP